MRELGKHQDKLKDKLLASADVSLDISLSEYSALFEMNGYIKFIASDIDYSEDRIIYTTLVFDNEKNIIDYLKENVTQYVLDFTGKDDSNLDIELNHLDKLKEEGDTDSYYTEILFLLQALTQYYSAYNKYYFADNSVDLAKKEGLI